MSAPKWDRLILAQNGALGYIVPKYILTTSYSQLCEVER